MSETQQELPGMPKFQAVDREAKKYLDAKQEVKNAQDALQLAVDKVVAAMKEKKLARYVFSDADGDRVFSIESKAETLRVKRAKIGSRPRGRKAKV